MEKLSSIIHKSALETYDLVEKNKTLIVQLITMFIPKETRDFILNEKFEFNTYYSKAELEAMDIKKQGKKSKKTNTDKNKNIKNKKNHKQHIELSKSINKSKVRAIIQCIPESLLHFLIFFSYLSLHSIYFWSVFIIILFVTNIHYLLIGLFIAFVNAIGTVIFSDCPIAILERKYRNKLTDNQHFMCNIIKKLYDDQIYYNYKQLLEQLIFAIFVIFIKINLIVLYKCFCK
jgi:hypothetical protein